MPEPTTNPMRAWRDGHGLTQAEAAPIFGVKLRKYQQMEADTAIPMWAKYVMDGYDVNAAGDIEKEIQEWMATARSTLDSMPSVIRSVITVEPARERGDAAPAIARHARTGRFVEPETKEPRRKGGAAKPAKRNRND